MQGVSAFIREGCCAISRVMNYHNSLDGFTAAAKTMIAAMKWRKHFREAESEYWDKALKNFELQKDLLYASVFFQNAGEFIAKTVTFNADGTSTASYHLIYPGKDRYDTFVKVSQIIGNFFEMIQCSMKWIFGTPVFLTNAGNRVGNSTVSLPVFGPTNFDKIPVAEAIIRKPKDLFIFIADMMIVGRYLWEFVLPPGDANQSWQEQYSWDNKVKFSEHACKFISSLGKMILIAAGGYYGQTGVFRYVDLGTQVAFQWKLIAKKELERDECLAGR